MTKRPTFDEYDPWSTYNTDAPVMRRHSKRQRKPTLASALRVAGKAGVAVAGAVVHPDGSVKLEFGSAIEDGDNVTIHSSNPWDRVLQ
jgi:hypothetical protein